MTRLNQSRRQLIGYVYCPQVNNDITIPTSEKSLSNVVSQSFERNMTGSGRIYKQKKYLPPDTSKIQFDDTKSTRISSGNGIGLAGGELEEIVEGAGKHKKVKKLGKGLPQMGDGLNIPGVGLNIPGVGLGLPGRGIGLPGSGKNVLPGELLKKKILKKLIREKQMKKMYVSDGASRTKDLPSSKGYVLKGSGKGKKGGFFPFIIAAIAAACSAASAVAATTVVGSVTVGSLVGATLTGAATTAGALAVKKIAGAGKHKGKKGGALLETLKPIFVKAAEQAKFTIDDFSKQAQEKIVEIGNVVKNDPSVSNIKKLGETIAPYARELIKEKITEKVAPKLEKVGLNIGSGFMKGKGVEADKFDNNFVKAFTTEMKTQV